MGRYSGGGSYGHWCRTASWGYYEIGWTVDRYARGSRLRFPSTYSRHTDDAGARRFCKKWNLPLPDGLKPNEPETE